MRCNRGLSDQDQKLLSTIQNILFKELAVASHTSFEAIMKKAQQMIGQNQVICKKTHRRNNC